MHTAYTMLRTSEEALKDFAKLTYSWFTKTWIENKEVIVGRAGL